MQCGLSQAAAETFSRTWNVWAYIHETYASLYCRSGDLEQAKRHADLAIAALEEADGAATTSWTAGLCAYRAGEVAILQHRVQDAIDQAQRSYGSKSSLQSPHWGFGALYPFAVRSLFVGSSSKSQRTASKTRRTETARAPASRPNQSGR